MTAHARARRRCSAERPGPGEFANETQRQEPSGAGTKSCLGRNLSHRGNASLRAAVATAAPAPGDWLCLWTAGFAGTSLFAVETVQESEKEVEQVLKDPAQKRGSSEVSDATGPLRKRGAQRSGRPARSRSGEGLGMVHARKVAP